MQTLIRPIEFTDNAQMASIIREVMTSFGAVGPGYSIEDPEVDSMYETYQTKGFMYYVVENAEGKVIGGCGIAPLEGEEGYCELRKMYYLPEARGKGIGMAMMQRCLGFAEGYGYTTCYLETLSQMFEAEKLYKRSGFSELRAPLGNTGHNSCDKYYERSLG